MTNVDTSVWFLGVKFKNPIVTASGTFGNGKEYARFFDPAILGGITTKAISLHPREGNKSPRLFESTHGLLNSIGLQNKGIDAFTCDDLPYLDELALQQTHIIANISGSTVDEYRELASRLDGRVEFIEVNISCPNVKDEGMAFGQRPEMAAEVTEKVRGACKTTKVIVKLTPNVSNIAEIAKAVEYAGADAISLINTLLGMRINPYSGDFCLANKMGGYSGPAIFPVAIRCVFQAAMAVNIPILGMGGVSSGEDVAEMMRAGATLVAIGTSNFLDVDNQAPVRILREFEGFCQKIHKNASDLIGASNK